MRKNSKLTRTILNYAHQHVRMQAATKWAHHLFPSLARGLHATSRRLGVETDCVLYVEGPRHHVEDFKTNQQPRPPYNSFHFIGDAMKTVSPLAFDRLCAPNEHGFFGSEDGIFLSSESFSSPWHCLLVEAELQDNRSRLRYEFSMNKTVMMPEIWLERVVKAHREVRITCACTQDVAPELLARMVYDSGGVKDEASWGAAIWDMIEDKEAFFSSNDFLKIIASTDLCNSLLQEDTSAIVAALSERQEELHALIEQHRVIYSHYFGGEGCKEAFEEFSWEIDVICALTPDLLLWSRAHRHHLAET